MILVVFGTTGELIKLAPVLLRLDGREAPYVLTTTGQQVEQIPTFLRQFGLRQPDAWLAKGAGGRDLRTTSDIPGWLVRVMRSYTTRRRTFARQLRGGPEAPLVLVHGDTMTTVLGALMGRALRVPVAHIEGGLRSGDLRNPFPEELNRRLTSRIAAIHYAPGAWAASNLERGTIVDTGSNTIVDSLELVSSEPPSVEIPQGRFGLVSLHRFELLNDRRALTETLEALRVASRRMPLLFVDHSVTVAAVERFALGGVFDDERFRRIPRLPFFEYVRVQRRSAFVVTDSGGSQEECFHLDLPCLVHRRRTERREGVGENVVVSGLRVDRLREFLERPEDHRRRSRPASGSPSDVIVDDLVRRGVVV